jgi:hypothetical protein
MVPVTIQNLDRLAHPSLPICPLPLLSIRCNTNVAVPSPATEDL